MGRNKKDETRRELTNLPPEGLYALDVAPGFLQNGSSHYCHWGKAAWQDVPIIQEVVQTYRPGLFRWWR